MKRICCLWIAALLLAGCATSTASPTPTLPIAADTPNPLPEPTDPTQLITVGAGETFELVLTANSSTGFHWELVEELDANVIELVSQDYITQEPVMPGSGGVDIWTMRAINPGDTTIMLGYYPPGNDLEPAETVIFSIAVE